MICLPPAPAGMENLTCYTAVDIVNENHTAGLALNVLSTVTLTAVVH